MSRKRGLSAEKLETLEKRLASWKATTGPAWLMDNAPGIIAEIEAEIESRAAQSVHGRFAP